MISSTDTNLPSNHLIHTHDGYSYTYFLENGVLCRRIAASNILSGWKTETVLPQTAVAIDSETGEQYSPDPERENYIAALKLVLETCEPLKDDNES